MDKHNNLDTSLWLLAFNLFISSFIIDLIYPKPISKPDLAILVLSGISIIASIVIYNFAFPEEEYLKKFMYALFPKLNKKTLTSEELFLKNRKVLINYLRTSVERCKANPDPMKVGWKYQCFEELVLDYGIFMSRSSIDYHNTVLPDDPIYVEGFAATRLNIDNLDALPLVIPHVWFTTGQDKKALEPSFDDPFMCYIGIPLNSDWLIEQSCNDEFILMTESLRGFEFLKNGLPQKTLFHHL